MSKLHFSGRLIEYTIQIIRLDQNLREFVELNLQLILVDLLQRQRICPNMKKIPNIPIFAEEIQISKYLPEAHPKKFTYASYTKTAVCFDTN